MLHTFILYGALISLRKLAKCRFFLSIFAWLEIDSPHKHRLQF